MLHLSSCARRLRAPSACAAVNSMTNAGRLGAIRSHSHSSHNSAPKSAPQSTTSYPSLCPPLQYPRPLYDASITSPNQFTFSKYVVTPKVAAIVGAPMALGQPQVGVDQGPAYIRSGGLHKRLAADDWVIDDRGDVNFSTLDADGKAASMVARNAKEVSDSPLAINSLSVGYANKLVYDAAIGPAKENKFVLTLGGDHSIAIGSIAAIIKARPDTGIIWVDAHADINTPTSSQSKNIHGMVLSFLMNLDNCRNHIPGFEWMEAEKIPCLRPDRVVYIGLRDLDWGEKQILKSLNMRAFTMKDVDHLGIAEVMKRATDHVLNRDDRPIHLTFDIDSIDPMYAPSTGTRVSGGLTYREAYYICEIVAETGMLASMDLVEVNPSINENGQAETVSMAVGLCASAMGNKIL